MLLSSLLQVGRTGEPWIDNSAEGGLLMSNVAARWTAFAPELRSLLRIVAAFVFIQAGTVKLFGWPMAMPGGGTVPLMSQMGLGGSLEVVGGSLLLIGLFTRPVAFILAGEMAVAYFQFHFPQGLWPVVNQGQQAVLFCFTWLYFSSAGAGPWSVDALRKSSPPVSI
jgi:putative oxidoreductase